MAATKKRAKIIDDKQIELEQLGIELGGKKPPQALEYEDIVLGAMLIEPNCVEDVVDELSPECFLSPRNRLIYNAIVTLVNEYSPVDLTTVSSRLKSLGDLEKVGGVGTLAALSSKIGAASHVEYYVKVLKEKRILRDLITAAHGILKASFEDSVNVEELMDSAQSNIYEAIQDGVKKDIKDIGTVLKEVIGDMEKQAGQEGYTGVPSGYPSLDDMTLGWQASDLIILAARPSVGKTAFALNVARNAAVDANVPVAFFSLEMPAKQLVKRLITSETEFSAEKIKTGNISEDEWSEFNSRLHALSKAPFYIDDTASLPVMEFRSKLKRWVKTKGIGLAVVDYLQLMQGPADLRGVREQEVAAISRTLKATAKELNIPIIALSQLSRESVKMTSSQKPQLSHLRESGSIEQDADMVLFVHRPDYVGMSEDKSAHGKTEIIIAKHRNGSVGDIEMIFKPEIVRFEEVSETLYNEASRNNFQEDLNNIHKASEQSLEQEKGEYNPFNMHGEL